MRDQLIEMLETLGFTITVKGHTTLEIAANPARIVASTRLIWKEAVSQKIPLHPFQVEGVFNPALNRASIVIKNL